MAASGIDDLWKMSRKIAALDDVARAACEQLAVCWGHGCVEKPSETCVNREWCKSRKILLALVKANYSLVLKRAWDKLPKEARE